VPEVRSALGLCDGPCKGDDIFATTASRREADCYLHGMLLEEVAHGSNWLENNDRKRFCQNVNNQQCHTIAAYLKGQYAVGETLFTKQI
jgi:hypothetical protein